MSEKSDFQLDAHAQSPADQVDTSSQPKKKKTSRPRLWKAVYWYFCNNMANQMHRFAIDNAQKAYLARWDEVMVPDVENLVDWIKLFVGISHRNTFAWMDSPAVFVIVLFSFFGYAHWYYDVNKKSDRFQAHIVALVSVAGFSVAMSVGFGAWISAFVVVPRAVIVGLLVSDFAHLVFPILRRRGDVCGQSGAVVAEKA